MSNQMFSILCIPAALILAAGCASPTRSLRTPDGQRLSADYLRGRSDAVKQVYWMFQDQQRTQSSPEAFRTYEMTIPEHWEDGVFMKPTKRILRINE